MKSLATFTNKYSLSKTLRFELKPVGRTLEHVIKNDILVSDEQRAEDYKKVKKLIDEYHKDFIGFALQNLELEGLTHFAEIYNKRDKDENDKKELSLIQLNLRKQIVDSFGKNANSEVKNKFDKLFKKELIQLDLIDWLQAKNDIENIKLVEGFKTFTTYFTGFNENRKNMYSVEEQSTAIAYRLIHENLPKHIDNIKAFNFIKEKFEKFDFEKVESEIDLVLQGLKLEELFSLEGFNQTLTQKGIDFYNTVLGGLTEKDVKKKIKGLNEHINLFRQENQLKNRDLPTLKILYKQILSDRESVSFLQDEFLDDEDVLNSIEVFYRTELVEKEIDGNKVNIISSLSSILKEIGGFDISKIYLRNDTSITDISQRIYGNWSHVKDALKFHYETEIKPLEGKKRTEKYDEDLAKWLGKSNGQFSIQFLQNCCTDYFKNQEEKTEQNTGNEWLDYFQNCALTLDEKGIGSNFMQRIEEKYLTIKDLLNTEHKSVKKLVQEQEKVDLIKVFLDEIVHTLHFIKPLVLKEDGIDKDEAFYSLLDGLFTQLDLVTPLYNKTRNYLTKKAFSVEKIKLNFENSQLLNGWDVNKETDNTSVLLRKNGLYYLCIMDKKHNKVFKNITESKGEFYEKVNYKLLPGANKMLPKVFFSNKSISFYAPYQELLANYKNETHKKGPDFSLKHCHELIDFFKSSIAKHPDWKNFNFQFSDTSSYEDLSGFYREVEHQGYKINFQNIDASYIDTLVEEGKVYLFQIYNKDFSAFSKGKPNLHTIYWKAVFDEENLKDVVYKLNGEAEVFFRKKSLEYDDEIWKIGHHAKELKNKFDYPIIKDKRYAVDKFQFHVPITMNFKATDGNAFNSQVNEYLKNNPAINIIGIDRGERHLLYLTLINQKGEILIQKSLNTITNTVKTVDYHERLHEKEKARDAARKSWGTIETIKELKEGYLSLVIHEIAKLMVEHQAIVVLEDLNFGFMRGRQKVEKQVYQKFEKMLIDKLNYLIFKDKKATEIGGYLKALQLTGKFESFQKLGKQSGFLFYVPAALTSKIDPNTGFVNFLDTRYQSIEKAKAFFAEFSNIQFNPSKDYFEFEFDYNRFTSKAEGTRTKWKVCTHGAERWRYNPQTKMSERVNVTAELKALFEKNNISFKNGNDLKQLILEKEEKGIYSSLLHLLGLTLSLRHSESGTENDFILSSVANEKGEFFDSRKASEQEPKDSDANGAYHIALKGLWALEQINKCTDWKKLKLAISNKEWLAFVQSK
jgi:hypothetical protein